MGMIGRRVSGRRGWNRYRVLWDGGLEGTREGVKSEDEGSSNYLSWEDYGGEEMVYDMRVRVLM